MQDPTADEMRAFLKKECAPYDDFDIEEGIYWFANSYHGGQGSNLYAALSTSDFNPGPMAKGPQEAGRLVMSDLMLEFA